LQAVVVHLVLRTDEAYIDHRHHRPSAGAALTIAQAYPRTGVLEAAANDQGPIDLHLADGFAEFREVDAWSVVRKAL